MTRSGFDVSPLARRHTQSILSGWSRRVRLEDKPEMDDLTAGAVEVAPDLCSVRGEVTQVSVKVEPGQVTDSPGTKTLL